MSLLIQTCPNVSPFIEQLTFGHSLQADCVKRPAEIHWHLVLIKRHKQQQAILVGPWQSAGQAAWEEDAELIWIKFRLGTFLAPFPVAQYANSEQILAQRAHKRFQLLGDDWEFPRVDQVEDLIKKLKQSGKLVHDPLIEDMLAGYQPELAPRTIRHRFLQATGLTQSEIRQFQRAKQATELLSSGSSIADTLFELDYFDQAHLTRSLKRWFGQTPGQFVRGFQARNCRSVQDIAAEESYAELVD